MGESPVQQATRLAQEKALKVAESVVEALVIGSDQVVEMNGTILGKPGTHERAIRQLQQLSGQCVHFHTGLAVVNSVNSRQQSDCISVDVHFRELSDDEIHRYLDKEKPYNCAGSFKSESLGIALVTAIEGPDPSALMGLPLVRLREMFAEEGLNIP